MPGVGLVHHHNYLYKTSWWRHQMETFSALLTICAGNSPVPGEFPAQRPMTRRFDVFFDMCLNKRFNKQSWGWWFETLSRPFSVMCTLEHAKNNCPWGNLLSQYRVHVSQLQFAKSLSTWIRLQNHNESRKNVCYKNKSRKKVCYENTYWY